MALVQRYAASVTSPYGGTTDIKIYQEGYSGSVETLEISEEGIKIILERRDDVPWWTLGIDSVEITINDADKLFQFSPLYGLVGFGERNVKLVLNNGSFEGWLKPRQMSFDAVLPGTITLVFTGEVTDLESYAYLTAAGNRVKTRASLISIIKDIIDRAGSTDANSWFIATNMHARMATGQNLAGTLPEPMFSFKVDREIFWNEDLNEGNDFKGSPIDMMYVLNQIALGNLVRIFRWEGSVWVLARDLRSHLLDEDTVQIWEHPASLGAGVLQELDYAVDIDVLDGTNNDTEFLEGFTLSLEDPIKSASITYFHRKQAFALVGNPYFVDDIQSTSGDGILNWKPSDASIVTNNLGRGGVPYEPRGLQVPSTYFNLSDGLAGEPSGIKQGIIDSIPHFVYQKGGYIEGGAGRFFGYITYLKLLGDAIGNYGECYTAIQLKIGSYWMTVNAAGEFSWKSSVSGNEEYLVFPLGRPSGDFQELFIPAAELVDGTTPISGNLEIWLYQVVEDYNGTASAGVTAAVWDDNIALLTDENGGVYPEATVTSCVETDSNNTKSVSSDVPILFGSGPTQGHRSRLTALDNLGNDSEITPSSFQVGNDFTGAISGMSRDELWCDIVLRQTQVGLIRIIGRLNTLQGGFQPYQVLRKNFTAFIVTANIGESTITTTNALVPLRVVDIDGETNRVTSVRKSGSNYICDLESPLAASHNGLLKIARQRIILTWDRLVYDPIAKTVDGEWTEIFDGAGGVSSETYLIEPPALSSASGVPSIGSVITQIYQSDSLATVPYVSSLSSQAIGAQKTAIMVRVFSAASEYGGGIFVGDPDDTTTPADGGTVIVSSDGGRWKRLDMIEGKPWSPTWFGAKFDLSNDQPAWQDMVDAAPYGATIEAPAGLGMIDSTILIDGKALTIRGNSESYWADTGYTPDFAYASSEFAGTKLYSGPNLTGPMFKVIDTVTSGGRRNAVTFEKLHLIGNRQNGPNPAISSDVATDTYGIEIVQGWGVKATDVNIANFTDDGIIGGAGSATTSDVCHFTRVNCADNGGWGVQWNGADSWFLNCRFNFNLLGGALVGSSINTFQGCRFDLNVGPGARASGLQFNRFIDCVFDANDANGLHAGDGTTNVRNYVITGCTFANNGKNVKEDDGQVLQLRQRAGLWVFGGRGWNISNNTYADYEPGTTTNPKRQTYGLYLSDGWRDHRLGGAVFSGNTLGQTNLRSKTLTGRYNVLEHGVEQNAVDAYGALQELIDSVSAGSTLLFPDGNYLLGSTLHISKILRLESVSVDDLSGDKGAYIQAASTLDGPLISISSGGVTIERLNFFGSLSAPSTAATGVEWTAGTGGSMTRCVAANFRGPCIKVGSAAANILIRNCIGINSETNGLLVQGNNCQVQHGEYRQNDQYGIYSLGAIGTTITGAFVWNNGWDGIIVQDGQRVIVIGCTSRDNQWTGIRIRSGERHQVFACTCYGNGLDTGVAGVNRAGIAVIEGNVISVCHNHLGTNSGGAQLYGISFGPDLEKARILDNTFLHNATADYLFDVSSQGGLDIDLEGIATIDFGSIASGSWSSADVSLAGVVAGDAVILGPPSNWTAGLIATGWASALGTVKIMVFNATGSAVDPASGDWMVQVRRRGGTATFTPPSEVLTLIMQHDLGNPNLLEQA